MLDKVLLVLLTPIGLDVCCLSFILFWCVSVFLCLMQCNQ